MTSRWITATALALAIGTGPVLAQSESGAAGQSQTGVAQPANAAREIAANITDAELFVAMAGVFNAFVIETGTMAIERTTNEEVGALAQLMVPEQQAAQTALSEAIARSGTELVPPAGPDAGQAESITRMLSAAPEQFDTLYVEAMIEAHDTAIALLGSYGANGDNEALRAYAAQWLPRVETQRSRLEPLRR